MSGADENDDDDPSQQMPILEPSDLHDAVYGSRFSDVIQMIQDNPKILVQNVREYGFHRDEALLMALIKKFTEVMDPIYELTESEDESSDSSDDEDYGKKKRIVYPKMVFPPSWSTEEWRIQDHEKYEETKRHPESEKSLFQAIQFALEIWPEAIHDVTKDGRTALHIAHECGAPDEVIARLQQESPPMMEVKDKFGHFPHDCASARKLRVAALKRQWSQFITLLDNNPDIALVRFNTRVVRSDGGSSAGQASDTFLHFLLRMRHQRIPYGIFQALLTKCPQVAKVHNTLCGCPMHMAMEYNHDEETILELLRHYPECAEETGYLGLPIEMALKREDESVGVLKPISEASRNIELDDSKAMELLTLAVHREAFALEAVMAILKAAPGVATQSNSIGDYPLYSLMGRFGCLDVFEQILNLYPDILSIRDLNRKSLLHVAYENHASQETIDKMQQMRNELKSERDLYGRLPNDMTSSKSEEIFVPMNSCLLLSDTKGFMLPTEEKQQSDDNGRVVLCQKNILMRDPSPEQKGDWILWNKTFGEYFNDQVKARAVIFKTLVEEFANLVQLNDKKVIQRAAVLQALACQHLSQGENTIVDLSSLKQEGYWYQQEVLKLVMRIYNEDKSAVDDCSEPTAIFSDGSNCVGAIRKVFDYTKYHQTLDIAMSEPTEARVDCFMNLINWLVDGFVSEDSYDIIGPNRKSLQSLFNKFYIRRGQTKVNILGDATRATLAIKDIETLLKVKERIEEHFPSIIPGKFKSADKLGTIGFMEYIHKLPKVPGTNIIPYRFKPNGSQKKENADNPLWFNLNFFDGIPEYHRSGNSEIFVAFELQIGLKEEIEKHRKSHVAYERDRILEGQPCLKNYIDCSEKILHNQPLLQNHFDGEMNASTCTTEDTVIIEHVLEGTVASEVLKKVKDVVFYHPATEAPSSSKHEEESPKRLCVNSKQFNMMPSKTLAGPFSLDPTKRYFVHSLSTEYGNRDNIKGSVGLYAHVGPYRVELALGTKPSKFFTANSDHFRKFNRFRVPNIVKPGNNYAYFERVCSLPPRSTAIDLTLSGGHGICEKMELVLHEFVLEDEDEWAIRTKIE